MIRQFYPLLGLILLSALVACAGAAPTATAPVPPPTSVPPTTDPAQPRPTPTVPAPENLLPPTDYPVAEPTEPPPPTDTPAEPYLGVQKIWILRPFAEQQCTADGSPPPMTYPDLAAAIDDLADNGVQVLESSLVALPVCAACNCPSSDHYRIQINVDDLATAEALGWQPES